MSADPISITAHYRYWRGRLLISMVVGYAAFYLTRRGLTFAMPVMQCGAGTG